MKKAVYAIMILAFLLPLFPERVLGYIENASVVIRNAELSELAYMALVDGETEWTGSIPFIILPDNDYFCYEINNKIREICTEKLTAASALSARSVFFRYDYRFWNNYASILVYVTTTLNHTKEEVISINFDISRAALIDIRDILGVNAEALVNIGVSDEIRKAPDNFNAGFSGVGSKIDFYAENGHIAVLFDKYEIAPGSRGIVSIFIDLGRVNTFVISHLNYLTKPAQYVLKLVPLELVCNMLGYVVTTDSSTGVIEIYKNGMVITCSISVNNYYRLGEPSKYLEAPPEMYFDSVYVPVSFLEQMLGAAYSVDYDDNIIVSYIDGD